MGSAPGAPLAAPPNDRPALKKALGVREVFSIAAGAMISSGLFVLPGVLYEMTGPSTWMAYLLAAVLVLPALWGKAELGTAMPKAGGTYYYVDRALGPAMGTLGGFAAWFSLSLKTAFALFGVGASFLLLEPLAGEATVKAIAIGVTVGATLLNMVGVHSAARVQNALVTGLMLVLLGFVALGAPHVDLAHFERPFTDGAGGLALATGTAFVSYGGVTKAAAMAEEMEDPGRILPRAMFLAFGIVTLLYVAVVVVTIGVLGPAMSGDLNPVAHAANRAVGTPGLVLLTAAALTAYLTTGNAGVMAASRMPMAMSRDDLLPRRLAQVHPRLGTPLWSVGFTGLLMVGSIALLDLATLVKTASVMMILLFLAVNVAVIVMRESRVEFYRPTVTVPLYPLTPALGVVAYAVLAFKLGLQPVLLAGGFLLAGGIWYALYARVRVHRESAVLHIVGLEAELRGVLRDRDGLEADEFDHLVHDALVLDLDRCSHPTMAAVVGDSLGPKVGMGCAAIREDILRRERKTSSVMLPGMAVIQLKAPGEGRSQMLLLRCREGIPWPGTDTPVHAVAVLATSKDRRHQRLRSLTALAQVAGDPEFGPRWMRVRDPASLIELLSMGRRHRDEGETPFRRD